MPPMLNETTYWAMVNNGSGAVSKALNVCQSLDASLCREVRVAVYTPVQQAGPWDLGWAVYQCCNENSPEEIPPGLDSYLEGVA